MYQQRIQTAQDVSYKVYSVYTEWRSYVEKMYQVCSYLLVLIFMYVPILILAVYSFTDAPNIGPIHGFSLQNYITLFTTEELRDMITGSIMLALGSAVLATILGTTGAIGDFILESV